MLLAPWCPVTMVPSHHGAVRFGIGTIEPGLAVSTVCCTARMPLLFESFLSVNYGASMVWLCLFV